MCPSRDPVLRPAAQWRPGNAPAGTGPRGRGGRCPECDTRDLAKLENFRGDAAFLTWASKFGISAAAATLRRRRWRDVSLEDMSEGWDRFIAEPVATDVWA